MFVIIAGGGRTGTQLASVLLQQSCQVRLIEHRRDLLARLHRELPTEVIYEGMATNPATLEQAGIRQAQVLAACTTNDADNLALCFLARSRYNVIRTIARINNPRHSWLYDQKFHVDVALNQADLMAKLIAEEMSLGDMMTLLKLRRGRYSVVEEKVPAGAPAVGKAIKDLVLPQPCVIAVIIRHGDMILPHGTTIMQAEDEVLAVTDQPGAETLAQLFARPGPPAPPAPPARPAKAK
jgi:trk system potassium uptake protein TrkA